MRQKYSYFRPNIGKMVAAYLTCALMHSTLIRSPCFAEICSVACSIVCSAITEFILNLTSTKLSMGLWVASNILNYLD